jgi:serine/threonine protein kinase
MKELSGATIGQYCLLRHIARGGMSEVYLAQDCKNTQEVAIKLVHANDIYCERFQREVQYMSVLQHKHILPVLDYGEYESWLYLVTPYIAQGTLDTRLAAGPLSPDEANEVLQQLADALQFAHERGVIHRDIKPSNVLLAEGMYVYLADFGLVKSRGEQYSLTQTGFLVGTPAYIAPEMLDSRATTASDIYALGVLLYQMLTGQLPFQADTPLALVWKHLQEEPMLPSTLNPALSPAVDDVILHALEKDPKKRFGTPRELAGACQRALHYSVDSALDVIPESFTANKIMPLMAAVTVVPVQKGKKVTWLTAGLAAGLCITVLLLSIFISGLQQQPSYSSSIPDRPTATSTPSHQPGILSTGTSGEHAQGGNTSSQGQAQSPQNGSTTSPAAQPVPSAARPAPPAAQPAQPKPAHGHGHGKKK